MYLEMHSKFDDSHRRHGALQLPQLDGPTALELIKGLNVDRSFMACNGAHLSRGITTLKNEQAQVCG